MLGEVTMPLGVIVQGFKQDLQIGGVPIGRLLIKEEKDQRSAEFHNDGQGRAASVAARTW